MQNPSSAEEHYERGRQLKRVRKLDQAVEAFQRAARDPFYAELAYIQMAHCLRALGRYDEAVEAFRLVLGLATFSSKDKAQILYLLGQTLESLGRYAEALEAYGWTRKEDPEFQEVVQRIKHLCAGKRGPLPQRQPAYQSVVEEMLKLGRQLKPQVLDLLEQTWESIGQYTGRFKVPRWSHRSNPGFKDADRESGPQEFPPTRYSPATSADQNRNNRKHARVAVRLKSHFSSKSQTVAGEGELRDLSPGGCRVTSSVPVAVGAELECLIFPQGAANPFNIEGATVRWSRAQEFGLSFTKVRPGVQRQIAQLCGARTLHGVSL